jgi:transposase-like protein
MNQERNFFLENDDDNKANGYYERSLNTGSFKLNINVPRDRKGDCSKINFSVKIKYTKSKNRMLT